MNAIDQMIDRVIQAAEPELRIALRSVLVDHIPIHEFTIADNPNSQTGSRMKIECFLAMEPAAVILEGTARGNESSKIVLNLHCRQIFYALVVTRMLEEQRRKPEGPIDLSGGRDA